MSDEHDPALVVSLLLDASDAGPGEIQRTIRSLLAQTDSRWEVLVRAADRPRPVDDPRIRHLPLVAPQEGDEDESARLEALLAVAAGEFVALMSAGAELLPEAVGVLLSLIHI